MSGSLSDRNAEAIPGAQFTTTHWSLVLAAAETASPCGHEALEKLCRTYWSPIYAFVRRQGHNPDDARDLTQGFFAHFLEKKCFKIAKRERGRFRSFLSASLKNFLTNEWRADQAQKRGSGQMLISLDEQRNAETRFLAEPADPATTPDRAFEKRWALTLLEKVLALLQTEFGDDGKQAYFDALKIFVWGDSSTVSQADVAASLGITPNALGVAVHRLRRRFGELLREEIAQTVATPTDIDDELRHLMNVLGS